VTDIPTQQTSALRVLPSYVYQEFSDSDSLQAFASAYNQIAQGYLDWFNETPLPVYTSDSINGFLLDWIGTRLYDIRRPVIGSMTTFNAGAVNTFTINTIPVNASTHTTSGTASAVSDDIYKRVLTWWLYSGDGKVTSIDWVKRRVTRFLYGVNGTDAAYPQEISPSITVGTSFPIGAVDTFTVNALAVGGSGTVTIPGFTITVPPGAAANALQALVASGALPLPFQNKYTVLISDFLFNDGGLVALSFNPGYPTSPTGLNAGALWSNGGLVCVVPGSTPQAAPAIYFSGLNAITLLNIGGANLPTSNPGSGTGQLWNYDGIVSIA
jgi:hypothetical protein